MNIESVFGREIVNSQKVPFLLSDDEWIKGISCDLYVQEELFLDIFNEIKRSWQVLATIKSNDPRKKTTMNELDGFKKQIIAQITQISDMCYKLQMCSKDYNSLKETKQSTKHFSNIVNQMQTQEGVVYEKPSLSIKGFKIINDNDYIYASEYKKKFAEFATEAKKLYESSFLLSEDVIDFMLKYQNDINKAIKEGAQLLEEFTTKEPLKNSVQESKNPTSLNYYIANNSMALLVKLKPKKGNNDNKEKKNHPETFEKDSKRDIPVIQCKESQKYDNPYPKLALAHREKRKPVISNSKSYATQLKNHEIIDNGRWLI